MASTSQDFRVPVISREIVEYFERIFPDRAGHPKDSLSDLYVGVGQAVVVRKMRSILHQQETEDPEE